VDACTWAGTTRTFGSLTDEPISAPEIVKNAQNLRALDMGHAIALELPRIPIIHLSGGQPALDG
jgi:hypothetical protein